MKVRIKFAKEGAVKFVGHLDTMRYFQKAIRRADIPVAYSEGFSPHMIMSFAAPLGVGTASQGEYFDMELATEMPTAEITKRLNDTMAEGFTVIFAVAVEDGKASKAMSLVAAADYLITFRDGYEFTDDWKDQFDSYIRQDSIIVHKITKRSEKDVDIRPYIYEARLDGDSIFLRLAAASSNYTRPEQVIDGFGAYLKVSPEAHTYEVKRLDIYADVGSGEKHQFVTLESLGEEIE